MRKEIVKTIIKRIKLRECTHIQGKTGLGKTTILKEIENKGYGIYSLAHPLKQIVISLSKKEKGTIYELSNLIIPEKTTLLLDDIEIMTRVTKRFIKKLMTHGLVIVSAGSKNIFGFFEIKLKELSFEDSLKLVKKHIKNDELAKIIVNEIGGNPSLLINAVRKANARDDLLTNKGFKEFKKSLGLLTKRKELISPIIISIASSTLITIRYFFYTQHLFKEGYFVAMLAYALITLGRVKRKY